VRSGVAPDGSWRFEYGLVDRQQFRGVEQFVVALEQLLEFLKFEFFELFELFEFLELLEFFALFEFHRFVLQFRRRVGFVRRFRTEYEALGLG
jgi:hypothetical protein